MQTTLAFEIWPQSRDSRIAQVLLVVVGTALLAVSARVQVPFWPVPMTMQTFVVLVLGIYLLEGALGLPVFAKGAGFAYLIGPTGGYLFGFLAAMTLMGVLARRGWDRNVTAMLGAMLIGESLIFLMGVGWLATLIGASKAITFGLTPFLAAEVFKIALAVVTVPMIWRLIRR